MKLFSTKSPGIKIALLLSCFGLIPIIGLAQIPGGIVSPPPLYGGSPTVGSGSYGGTSSLFSPGGFGTTGPSIPSPSAGTGSPAPTSGPGGSGTSPLFLGGLASGVSILLPYDPMVDNHLKAPPTIMGLFGRPIKEVEGLLKSYGAKPHSYAFGKYSQMTFSVYLITMNFSRERRLGSIQIKALPPFSHVENQAKQFLMKLFLEGANMNQFATTMASGEIEIKYAGY